MRELEFHITEPDAGRRAADYLRRSEGFSYNAIVKLRHSPESLLLSGVPIRTIDRLFAGGVLTVRLPDSAGFEIPRPELAVPIIYEDEDIILFNKPAGMPCHTAKGHPSDTIANFYAAHCPESRFRVLGRLDMDSSGLVLAAKNARAAQVLTDTSIVKEYYAILCATPPVPEGIIDLPIEDRDPEIRRRFVSPGGRAALTRYRVLCACGGTALVSALPETGRTHQLRVHFSHIGCPLLGDSLYGQPSELISRHALHRVRLAFNHPITGKPLEFFSPLPPDMAAALSVLSLSSPELPKNHPSVQESFMEPE